MKFSDSSNFLKVTELCNGKVESVMQVSLIQVSNKTTNERGQQDWQKAAHHTKTNNYLCTSHNSVIQKNDPPHKSE